MDQWQIIWEARELISSGLMNTLYLVLISMALSIPLGALAAIVVIESPGWRKIFQEFFDLLRCVPFLLLAYVMYYGLPSLGVRLSPWESGIVTLVLYNMAYFVEIFVTAYKAISRADVEAADAYGFSSLQKYRHVIFPQIVLISAPLVGNQIITAMRDSALLMIITVQELTFAANFISVNHFIPFLPFVVAVALYTLITLVVERGVASISNVRKRCYG
ncbi:amino acid ABC transporter membrane protein 2, PAAT family [Psychromonas ingrahamii 37]|uniref:Amino acid ABC transporter membrane protein 2, PAAT family n=1 Tax=Psychromonas ingrahamii (strain DSM 17664 / CCUG 51855 / 37) TaxID=357804 RepID=A1SS09_PSYIN|nr:ABC transporter permease subunit [Psychromonas ingrahamii]ABM02274.1 amino acid ABC transporter membrane protein 2, PAAT family [Psychromonas ingrahamii 37]